MYFFYYLQQSENKNPSRCSKTPGVAFKAPTQQKKQHVDYTNALRALTTKTTSELDVLGLDGDTLGVDGGQVGVFEETDEVCLRSFLKCTDGRGLEAEVGLEVLSDLWGVEGEDE